MSNDITRFDKYLTNAGPAALVIREYLVPVEGPDGVLFPPTFASGDGFPGGYNIDGETNGEKIALIDTVGAQSNRIEPMFTEPGYAELVPQVVIKAGAKSVNLLQASHRAGDAIVRCTLLQVELEDAFNESARWRRHSVGENRTNLARLRRLGLAEDSGENATAYRLDDSRLQRATTDTPRPI